MVALQTLLNGNSSGLKFLLQNLKEEIWQKSPAGDIGTENILKAWIAAAGAGVIFRQMPRARKKGSVPHMGW